MKPSIDAFYLASYRRHSASSVTCDCNVDGPDRECDLDWALWKCARPAKVELS